jgi:hypothetical protein
MVSGGGVTIAPTGFVVQVISKFIGHIIARPIIGAIFGAVGGLPNVAIQGNQKVSAP